MRSGALKRRVRRVLILPLLAIVSAAAPSMACSFPQERVLFCDDFETPVSTPKAWTQLTFWDVNAGWIGYTPHEYKYSGEIQEGALILAINRSDSSLDYEIQADFNYLHDHLTPGGMFDNLTGGEEQYKYGVALSCFALGYLRFNGIDQALADRCYADMNCLYDYVVSRWSYPDPRQDYSVTLRGYANTCKAFEATSDIRAAACRELVEGSARAFLENQVEDGYWVIWDDPVGKVQNQMKRDLGLLMAYDVNQDPNYLSAINANINWILTNRWDPATGGVIWAPYNVDFFDCHQCWFMAAAKGLYDKSGGVYDYRTETEQAWRFMTEDNYAGIDMYVHNYENYGVFWGYRSINYAGQIMSNPAPPHTKWKGNYEIGSSLWAMSLNYDLVSNFQSRLTNTAYNYLAMQVEQIKKPADAGPGCMEYNRTVSPALWETVGSPTVTVVHTWDQNVASIKGKGSHNDLVINTDPNFDDCIIQGQVKMSADNSSQCQPEISVRYADVNNRYIFMFRGEPVNDIFIRRVEKGKEYSIGVFRFDWQVKYYEFRIIVAGDKIDLYLDGQHVVDLTDTGTKILSGKIGLSNYRSQKEVYFDNICVAAFPLYDLDGDGLVNFYDYAIYVAPEGEGGGDVNDLSLFIADWLN